MQSEPLSKPNLVQISAFYASDAEGTYVPITAYTESDHTDIFESGSLKITFAGKEFLKGDKHITNTYDHLGSLIKHATFFLIEPNPPLVGISYGNSEHTLTFIPNQHSGQTNISMTGVNTIDISLPTIPLITSLLNQARIIISQYQQIAKLNTRYRQHIPILKSYQEEFSRNRKLIKNIKVSAQAKKLEEQFAYRFNLTSQ